MKTIIITGASDGIGAAAARLLTKQGHRVILVGRSKDKTEKLARELNAPYHLVDYTHLNEVKRLAEELKAYPTIDVLVNNAGGIMGPRQETMDGFEKTFQVNHLAPFLLTYLLLDRLEKSNAVVIQTASEAANLFGRHFNINDLNNTQNYQPTTAYGYGKLANILFTRELHRRYGDKGIRAVAFHPGVVRSNFAFETNHAMRLMYHSPLKYLFTISPEQSAKRLVKLINDQPGKDWILGESYNKHRVMKLAFNDNGTAARLLWDQSEQMIKNFIK